MLSEFPRQVRTKTRQTVESQSHRAAMLHDFLF